MKLPDEMPCLVTKLPLGFTATFAWSDGAMSIKWHPTVPGHIRSPRHRRKLLAAYQTARREFAEMLATVIGGAVLIVDPEPGDEPRAADFELVQPGKKH